MTLYTTGDNAGCAILNETVWTSTYLYTAYNSSNFLSEPFAEAVFAVDKELEMIQKSRIANFSVDKFAEPTVFDSTCTSQYDDILPSGDAFFDITMTLKDSLNNSLFSGQIPEGGIALGVNIDFDPSLLFQSPMMVSSDPSIVEISFCIRLRMLSEDGGESWRA